jgi:thymidylate synthase
LKTLSKPIDSELEKESPLLIVFDKLDLDDSIPNYDGIRFTLNTDYQELIQRDSGFVKNEYNHYQGLLGSKIVEIVSYLKANPTSKRAIIDVWAENQRDLSEKAECLVYLLFRESKDGLDLHIHMRANDAENKALLNFHIFSAIQQFVAKNLDLKVGKYYHFADSYHIYR